MSIYVRCFKLFYFCACTAVNMSGNMKTGMLSNIEQGVTFFILDVLKTCTSLKRLNSNIVITVIYFTSIFLKLSLN